MNHYVYEITNLINGKKYIGKRSCKGSIKNDKYMGSSKLLSNAINKYGINNFKKEIIFICKTEDEAYLKEEQYISLNNAVLSDKYYNLNGGGKGVGSGHNSPNFGKKISKEHSIRISEAQKGRIKSKEECLNISNSKKGDKNWAYGKTFTEEHKKKMSEARCGEKHWNYGNKMKEEQREKLSDYWKGKKIGGDNPLAVKIICLTTNEIFNSIADATRKYNVHGVNISKCCKGQRRSAGKLNGEKMKWAYCEDTQGNI